MKLKIGNLKLKNRLFLSPMVDVTDLPYRILCRKQEVAMAYTEMINIPAILHENKKTLNMMKTSFEDKPLGIQITGNKVEDFSKVLPFLDSKKYSLVDINCGCPSSRIVGNESGSYLLKNPKKIGDIIKVLKNSGIPVTAKIRLGFKENEVLKISKEIERAGADLITVHARTAVQRNREPADWSWISKVKKEIGIPVVGNGGVSKPEDVAKMLDIADGAMIASAAIGNPFIFREALRYLRTGKEKEVTGKERIKGFLDYISLAEKYDLVDIGRIHFLGGWFLRGFSGASSVRQELMKMKDIVEVRRFVNQL
ncbi:MAG: tRNA-dihydrouridine synthase family protein [Candidatus Pacearchaeota archaeon]|nr:tRNA-dihydrouridine synthase family protein [Candidatus Pacearchaeota archaeon]